MSLQTVRGFKDVFAPEETNLWQFIESHLAQLAHSYGYNSIRLPLMESTELFARSIGEDSDIVSKEMYTFADQGGQSLTLRPEGTAGCVRSSIQHSLTYDGDQRYFYFGPMFRRERPQKGRLRQFHQFGMEALGIEGPQVDIEQLQLLDELFSDFSLSVQLHLNFLGGPSTRAKHHEALKAFYLPYISELDPLDQKRYHSNTLRLLDSKSPFLQTLNQESPKLSLFHTDVEKQCFDSIKDTLTNLGIDYVSNDAMVRGLDYYTGLIYEWQLPRDSGQTAICGGGRYDGLSKCLGGKPMPACGFSIGVERLLDELYEQSIRASSAPKLLWANTENQLIMKSLHDCQQLRQGLRHYTTKALHHPMKLKLALKKANKGAFDYLVFNEALASGGCGYQVKSLCNGQQLSFTSVRAMIDFFELEHPNE